MTASIPEPGSPDALALLGSDDVGERALATVLECRARWHRVSDAAKRSASFDSGRAAAYVQVIAMLLRAPFAEVKSALERGEL